MKRTQMLAVSSGLALGLCMVQAQAAKKGMLDPTFGIDGIALTDFGDGGASDDAAYAQVEGPGGSTYLVGGTDAYGEDMLAIAKLQPDGTPDPLFGNEGRVIFPLPTPQSLVLDLWEGPKAAITSGGNLLVAANAKASSNAASAWVCRFTAEGDLDTTFGKAPTAGCRQITSPWGNGGQFNQVRELVVRNDGNIVVAGQFLDPEGILRHGVASLMPDGKTMQGSFGQNGFVFPRSNDGGNQAVVHIGDVELSAQGELVLLANSSADLLTLVKLDAKTGKPAPGFGVDGILRTKIQGFDDDVSLAADGSIYTFDYVGVEGTSVHRFLPTGDADPAFATTPTDGLFYEIQATADGVLAAVWTPTGSFLVRKLDATGVPQETFGVGGETVIGDGSQVTLLGLGEQGGRVVVSGYAEGELESNERDVLAARLDHGRRGNFFVLPYSHGNGTFSSGAQMVPLSNIAEFKVVPKPGYRVASVHGCGNGELIGTRYRTGPIESACVVHATFEKIPFTP